MRPFYAGALRLFGMRVKHHNATGFLVLWPHIITRGIAIRSVRLCIAERMFEGRALCLVRVCETRSPAVRSVAGAQCATTLK